MKEKELVTLRSKPLASGSMSLYLDYVVDGIRYKDYLKMYIVPERTKLDRRQNEETMKIAQAAKAKKILEIESGSVRIKRNESKDIPLYDYILQQSDEYRSRGSHAYARTLTKIAEWVRKYRKVSIRSVDKEYLMGFVAFLRDGGIAQSTAHMYFANLNTVFNRAYRAGIIVENPISRMELTERPQRPDTERPYLTLEEVQKLMATECNNQNVRDAFLFACFTGLRLSDIEAIQWKNIRPTTDGGWQVEAKQLKTQRIVYIPLSENAMAQLPERAGQDDRIFRGLPSRSEIGRHLRNWIKKAGIKKKITFHCSRHTNATLLLSFGADIYTVSALLGHTDISTTQIYAKVVDEQKRKAVSMIPRI